MSNPFAQDQFGVFSSSSTPFQQQKQAPPPPSYDEATQLPPPPSYEAALDLSAAAQPAAAAAAVKDPFTSAASQLQHPPVRPSRPAPAAPSRPAPAPPATAAAPISGTPNPFAAVVNPFADLNLGGTTSSAAASNPFAAAPLWDSHPASTASSPSPPPAAPPAAVAATKSPSVTADDLDWLQQALQQPVAATAPPQPPHRPSRAAPLPPGSHPPPQQQHTSTTDSSSRSRAAVPAQGGQAGSRGDEGAMPASYWETGNVGWSGAAAQEDLTSQNLHLWLRLPPLNPKASPAIKRLAAGLGHLVAGPAGPQGQLLHWALNLATADTLPPGATAAQTEDWDSAPAAELQPAAGSWLEGGGGSSKTAVSALHLDAAAGRLWAGLADGSVHVWALAPAAGAGGGGGAQSAVWLHGWKAHNGKVKALVLTPWGQLYTGSRNGAIKLWGDVLSPRGPVRLLRQLTKGPSREAPHGCLVGLTLEPGGGLLWSAGRETVCLWAAQTGEYVGTLRAPPSRGLDPALTPGHPGWDPCQVSTAGGVDPGHLGRCLEEVLLPGGVGEEGEGGEDAAALALKAAGKVVGKAGKTAMKFIGKVGKKIQAARGDAAEDSNPAPGTVYPGSSGLGSQEHYTPYINPAAAGGGGGGGGSGSPTARALLPADDKQQLYGDIKQIVASRDGSIWVGYKKGLLEQYNGTAGTLSWQAADFGSGISSLAADGDQLWVGGVNGHIWVYATPSRQLVRSWKAHCFPVVALAPGGPLVYSLAKDGSIRGWPAAAAAAAGGGGLPAQVTSTWQQQVAGCSSEQRVVLLVGSWNVAESKPDRAALALWLGDRAQQAQLVVVGLQEVEMGTASVFQAGVYERTKRSKLEEGTPAARAWAAALQETLGAAAWKQVALRQMSGVVVLLFARSSLERVLGEVSTSAVACGVMGVGGNKGAVAVSFSLYRRRVVALASHFAAHQDKVDARNKDYAKIVAQLHFHTLPGNSSSSKAPQQQQQQQGGALEATWSGGSANNTSGLEPVGSGGSGLAEAEWGAGVRDADALVWVGDFNYRVDAPPGFTPEPPTPERSLNDQLYEYVMAKISARRHLSLLPGDQATREMVTNGRIFHSMAEGPITFLPTYKFEKHRDSCLAQPFYDQGEKKRVPAWTDRIMFRGSGQQRSALAASSTKPSDVKVWLAGTSSYGSVLEPAISDHKPVYAQLQMAVPSYNQAQLRRYACTALHQLAVAAASGSSSQDNSSSSSSSRVGLAAAALQPSAVSLTGSAGVAVTVTNTLGVAVEFRVVSGDAGGALPSWLEVTPVSGLLGPHSRGVVRCRGVQRLAEVPAAGSCSLRVVLVVAGSPASSSWLSPAAVAGAAALQVQWCEA